MISNLADLIAPLSPAEFRTLLRRRAPELRRRAQRPEHAELMNWEILRTTLDGRVQSERDLRIRRDRVGEIPRMFYAPNDRIDIAKLETVMDRGASIIFSDVGRHVPALQELCAAIGSETGERTFAGVVVTTGAGGALELHFDAEDILVFQLEGSKRWRLYGPPVDFPATGMAVQPPGEDAPPVFDATVEAGDILFVPAGYWHRCENGAGRSMHLGFLFEPPTVLHTMRAWLQRLKSEEMLRTPLTRTEDPAALETRARQQLKDMIDRLSFRETK